MNNTTPPAPWKAVPTQVQLDWQDMEYYSLIHYGLNSYVNQEWGYGNLSPELFNPSSLDTDQWARVCKEAGMKGIIFVAKHHDGFCLWQTETTDYSLKASPWKDGKGDLVAELAESCRKYGLKLGIYISPWDRNHGEYGRDQYVEDYHRQWEELLTLYGDQLFEVWFDGANGGDGWYGGADEKRTIPKGYYQYDRLFARINELAPNAVLFGGHGLNSVRWGGNESGYVDRTNWSRFMRSADDVVSDLTVFEKGMEDGLRWMPAEADVPVKHKWFYHENSPFKSLKEMLDDYYETVGRNATLDYGIAVGPDGLIPEKDRDLLLQLKAKLDSDFRNDLIKIARLNSNVRRGENFDAENCRDESRDSYWATPDGVSDGVINIDFEKRVPINRILLSEPIQLGQRIHSFEVQARTWTGRWKTIAQETTIGAKRILRTKTFRTNAVRIRFQTKAPALAVSRISLYHASRGVTSPEQEETENPGTVNHSNFSISLSTGEAPLSLQKMTDGNPDTFGQVELNGADLILDMGEEKNISSLSYLPRQDRKSSGVVYQYRLQGSLDNKEWFILQEGRFGNIENNPIRQSINFPSRLVRFVKFEALQTLDQSGQFSCAELTISSEE